jgi:hypothetical protein
VGVGVGAGVGVGVGVGVGTGASAGGFASAVEPPAILQPPKRMHSAKGAILITRILSLPAPRLDEFQLYFDPSGGGDNARGTPLGATYSRYIVDERFQSE